jgi:hypothetical protein
MSVVFWVSLLLGVASHSDFLSKDDTMFFFPCFALEFGFTPAFCFLLRPIGWVCLFYAQKAVGKYFCCLSVLVMVLLIMLYS